MAPVVLQAVTNGRLRRSSSKHVPWRVVLRLTIGNRPSHGGNSLQSAKKLSLPSTPEPRVIISRSEPQAAVPEIPRVGPGEIWCGRADVPRPGDVGRHVVFEM